MLLRSGITFGHSSKIRSQLVISQKSIISYHPAESAISQRGTRNGIPGCSVAQNYPQQHVASKTYQNESCARKLTRDPRLQQKWILQPSSGETYGPSIKTTWSGYSFLCANRRNLLQRLMPRWEMHTKPSNSSQNTKRPNPLNLPAIRKDGVMDFTTGLDLPYGVAWQ